MIALGAGAAHAQEHGPQPAGERVLLRTTMGDMLVALRLDSAPAHVAQFLSLVRLGVYDTTHFSRVFPGYLIQLANAEDRRAPLTPEQAAAIRTLKAEFSGLRHRRGALTMAREPHDPDSARTSFCILAGDAPHLDGRYTVFGYVERGYGVLDAVANVERDAEGRPLSRVELVHAAVVPPADLANVSLRGPVAQAPVHGPPLTRDTTFVWISAALIAFGLMLFLFAGRIPVEHLRAYGLIAVLVGFFFLFALLVPAARHTPWLGTALFVATLAVFKLMTFFERGR